MATVTIVPDGDSTHRMTVEDQNWYVTDTPEVGAWWVAICSCGVSGSDRGGFEDTVQYALVHVEGAHE